MVDNRDPDLTRTGQTEPASGAPLLASASWGDLRLLDELGRGGFGRVYRAWDESLAREVALKIIKSRDKAHRTTVLLEGQMLARVKHRNVVTVFRAQQIADEVGLTMEFIQGRQLAQVVQQTGPMGAEEASVIGISLCQALAAVHNAGLLHRDVKAHNVMRESGGRIVLMDFGASRQLSDYWLSDLSGTPLYLAPELFAGDSASPASDLYSLGVLLFYLVTGSYPVLGRTIDELGRMHAAGARRLLSDMRPDLPGPFVQVVHRALSARPDQRSRSAGAMMAELAQAMPNAVRLDADTLPPVPIPAPIPTVWSALKAALPVVGRVLLVAAAAVPVVLVLGYLTTAHYDRAIGRSQDFSGEGVAVWLKFGFKALLPIAIYLTALSVLVAVVRAIWHFIQRLSPPVRRFSDLARTSVSSTFAQIGGRDPASLAEGLLLAQILALAVVFWAHWDLIRVLPAVLNEVDASLLAVVDPVGSNRELYTYAVLMSLVLGVMVISWYALLRRPAVRSAVPTTSKAAAACLLMLTLLLIVVPDRLFYKSEAEEVTYGRERCFVTGWRGDERLLYCPDAPKKSRTPIVKAADLTGEDAGRSPGWIFSPPRSPSSTPK